MAGKDAERLMDLYPRIFFACHTRHVRDPQTQELVTAHQASILDHLDEDEPMSLNDLAKHMGVTPATMSVAVDKLVDKGFVARQRSQQDRRKVLLTLTDDGRRITDASSVLEPERVEAMLAELQPAERERALDGLSALAEAADRYLARKGPGWKGE